MNTTHLTALAEPSRLRIVELLSERPRSVNEIAQQLEIRQPQASKHLKTLVEASWVRMYPLGQRRIYALNPELFAEVATWLGRLSQRSAESVQNLDEYLAQIQHEQALAAKNPNWAKGRNITVTHTFNASRDTIWNWWTSAQSLRQWWGPEHFSVARCELDIRPGGTIAIDLQERDGTVYPSVGAFTEVTPTERLVFTLSPLDPSGQAIFETLQTAEFSAVGNKTKLTFTVRINSSSKEVAQYIAGIKMGWEQSFSKLDRAIAAGGEGNKTM